MASNMFCCCLFLAMSQGWCTTMEPEPGMYSTSMEPEPGMSSMAPTSTMAPSSSTAATSTEAASTSMPDSTSKASGNVTTTASTAYQHTVKLAIKVTNLTGMTQASLVAKFKEGLEASSSGSSATVTLQKVVISSKIGNLPFPFDFDKLIESFAKMCNVDKTTVMLKNSTTNYTYHSDARRLQDTTGDFGVDVANTDSNDVVAKSNTIMVAITPNAFATQLQNDFPAVYVSLTLTEVEAPGAEVVVTTVITTNSQTAPTDNDISTQISNKVPGATVTVTYQGTVVAPVTSTGPAFMEDDSASLASMFTFWVMLCAFLTN